MRKRGTNVKTILHVCFRVTESNALKKSRYLKLDNERSRISACYYYIYHIIRIFGRSTVIISTVKKIKHAEKKMVGTDTSYIHMHDSSKNDGT